MSQSLRLGTDRFHHTTPKQRPTTKTVGDKVGQ